MINRRKKIKSITVTIILLTAIFFTTACQPTPKSPVVIQKDNFEDLVINTANPTQMAALTSTYKHITWEDNFIKEYPGERSTKITVKVNAPIDARQSTGSVYMVEPDNYNLDFAKRAVNYFIGDKYYDDLYTKDDFMLMILPLQKAIQSMQDNSLQKENAKSSIEHYQYLYASAPESSIPGNIAFTNATTDYIGLKGYPYGGAVSQLYVENGGMGKTAFYYVVQDGKNKYKDTNQAYTGIPARNMKKSYDEAKNIAIDAINKLYGGDMSLIQTDLYNVYSIDETYGSAMQGLLDNTCNQCYMFTFTPIYGGLPQLYAPEARNEDDMTDEGIPMYEQKWDYEYSMKWPAQYVQVLVDDSGIMQFWGFSPTKTTETINENVAMMSFNDIFEIFKKNIFYCSVWSDSGMEEVDIYIDSIVFGMIRVPMKDDPDTYYMIPAWQFVGSKAEKNVPLPEGLPPELKAAAPAQSDYLESGKTFLVLNAIDGSIIDTSYYINIRGEFNETIGVNKH